MKYFTKEFYALERLSYANRYVKVSKSAERKDEAFYRRVYEKRYAVFAGFEKAFDAELCKRKFTERNSELTAIYSKLPKEISDKIADMRVFALGYASAEVKRLLRPYCAELRHIVRQTRKNAYAETNEAEDRLSRPLGLSEYDDRLITEIREKDGDVYLKIEDIYLLFKAGEITEGKEKKIYPCTVYAPNSPWSRIVAGELHANGDKFETHFLISNVDETEKEDLWYLTVRGTDVLTIHP